MGMTILASSSRTLSQDKGKDAENPHYVEHETHLSHTGKLLLA